MKRIVWTMAAGRLVGLSLFLLAAFNGQSGVDQKPETRVEGVQVVAQSKEKNKPEGPHAFRMSGSAAGLFPGTTNVVLPVTVRNDNNFDMVVQELGADVVAVTEGSECPLVVDGRPTVVVTPFVGSLAVPAKGNVAANLAIGMDAAAPDACSGATFHLSYRGRAVKP